MQITITMDDQSGSGFIQKNAKGLREMMAEEVRLVECPDHQQYPEVEFDKNGDMVINTCCETLLEMIDQDFESY